MEELDAEEENNILHDGDDDTNHNNSVSDSLSGEDRIRGLLQEHGQDPQPLDFSEAGLFPNMPAAARFFEDIHNGIGDGTDGIVWTAFGRGPTDSCVHPMESSLNMRRHGRF